MTLIPASREISLNKVNSRAQWYFLGSYFVCSSIEKLTIKVFFFILSVLTRGVPCGLLYRRNYSRRANTSKIQGFLPLGFSIVECLDIHNTLSLPLSFLKKVLERLWNLKETGNSTNGKFWCAAKCTCTVGNWEIENDHKENEGTEASKSGLERKLFVLPRGSQSSPEDWYKFSRDDCYSKEKIESNVCTKFCGENKIALWGTWKSQIDSCLQFSHVLMLLKYRWMTCTRFFVSGSGIKPAPHRRLGKILPGKGPLPGPGGCVSLNNKK